MSHGQPGGRCTAHVCWLNSVKCGRARIFLWCGALCARRTALLWSSNAICSTCHGLCDSSVFTNIVEEFARGKARTVTPWWVLRELWPLALCRSALPRKNSTTQLTLNSEMAARLRSPRSVKSWPTCVNSHLHCRIPPRYRLLSTSWFQHINTMPFQDSRKKQHLLNTHVFVH